MNALAMLNPCHKCDLGNKNDYTDKKITADNTRLNNNYYNCTEIILYMCVTTYTPSHTKSASIRNAVLNQLEIRKQFCGCNRSGKACLLF